MRISNSVVTPTIPEKSSFSLAKIIALFIDNKKLIAATTLLALFTGLATAYLQKPVFSTDAMLQVESFSQTQNTLEQFVPFLKTDSPLMAEIELLKSRSVLKEVINNLRLSIVAEPIYFPALGEAIARHFDAKTEGEKLAHPFLGLSKYAWGGESIKVDTFLVPTAMLDIPFKLIAGKNGHFQLLHDNTVIMNGENGKLAIQQLNDSNEFISLFVSQLTAREGTEFLLFKQSESEAIDQLRKSFEAKVKAKMTNILEIQLNAEDPEIAAQILDKIITVFVQKNIDQKSSETYQKLTFLEEQTALFKKQLDRSTEALNTYKSSQGNLELEIEAQGFLEGLVKIESEITLLLQKREELRQEFTESDPSLTVIDRQIGLLQSQITAYDKRISALPKAQQDLLKLSRTVKADLLLYTTAMNKAQTLRTAKEGTVSDIRVIDNAAINNTPITPSITFYLLYSLVLGVLSGIAMALIGRLFHRGVMDPNLIENVLNIPVYATVPHSHAQENLIKQLKKNQSYIKDKTFILATQNKDDIAIESLRSLRTTLHFECLAKQKNIIMVTGPSPGIGKTFVTVNLAVVLADSGKKVLLIDADLRKGYINSILGVRRENGLSELISYPIPDWVPVLEKTIHQIKSVNLDFISSGAMPNNPSELLLQERFGLILENLRHKYDCVIIDSPPVLAVTDASIIGRFANATLLVAKSGQHSLRELADSAKRLSLDGVQIDGIVFNDLPESSSVYGFGYGSYTSKYQTKTSN